MQSKLQSKERKNGACNAGIGEARLHHSDSAAGKGLHRQDAPVKVGTDQDDASFSLYAKLAKAMHIRVTAKKRCAAGRGSHRCMEPTMQNRQRSCWCAPENAEPARAMHAQDAATCLLASKGKRLTHRGAQSRQGQCALLCSYYRKYKRDQLQTQQTTSAEMKPLRTLTGNIGKDLPHTISQRTENHPKRCSLQCW